MVANKDFGPRRFNRFADPQTLGQRMSERLLDKYCNAYPDARHDLIRVQLIGRCQNDSIRPVCAEHFVQ